MSCQERFCAAASASLEPAATAAPLNFKNNSRLFSSGDELRWRWWRARGEPERPDGRVSLRGSERRSPGGRAEQTERDGKENRSRLIPPVTHGHPEFCCEVGAAGQSEGDFATLWSSPVSSPRPHVPTSPRPVTSPHRFVR